MILISKVGVPQPGYVLQKKEWKKDEKIDDFTIPFNLHESTNELFKRFGLWQSSNGVCVAGIDHTPTEIGDEQMICDQPVLIGDTVMGVSVCESICEYLPLIKSWHCRVRYGEPPKPLDGTQLPEEGTTPDAHHQQESALLSAYVESDDALATRLAGAMGKVFEQVLPLCLCPANGPLNTGPAQALFATMMQDLKKDIKDIIDAERAQLWG